MIDDKQIDAVVIAACNHWHCLAAIWAMQAAQTAQGEVYKWQRSHPDFFENVKVPENIVDPKYKLGFGTTSITN